MNLTHTVGNIKKELGIGPFLKVRMTDDLMVKEILQQITIPTFSRYFKNVVMLYDIPLKRINMGGKFKIEIPTNIRAALKHMGMKIKGIKNIDLSKAKLGNSVTGTDAVIYAPMGNLSGYRYSGFTMENMANAFSLGSSIESMDLGLQHQFLEPDMIQFFESDVHYENYTYDIQLYTTHSNNMYTIGDNLANGFMSLAKLDFKRILWDSELKYVNGVETTYIKVDLKIDEWANADTARNELLTKWESNPFSNNNIVVI